MENIQIQSIIKSLKQSGDLRYEYNPLHNYRKKIREYKTNVRGIILDTKNLEKCLAVKKSLFQTSSFNSGVKEPLKLNSNIILYNYRDDIPKQIDKDWVEFSPLNNLILHTLITNNVFTDEEFYKVVGLNNLISKGLKNEIGDLTTHLLNFDLSHPVDILTQESYDGSVNLILNDDKNPSRIINSRFSVTEHDTYLIPERLNDNDANLYDETEWESDTRLQKIYKDIPKLKFLGVSTGGNFTVGNYVFYFKYLDADENATDFIAESGIVSCFIGNTPTTITSGWSDMNSNKLIEFELSNLDLSYKEIKVYFSKSSSDISGLRQTKYEEIVPTFKITKETERIVLTGFEERIPSSYEVINAEYLRWDCAKTQAINSNHLFIGNIGKKLIDYKDFIDLSLRINPSIYIDEKIQYTERYYSSSYETSGYYNTDRLYYKTGYWPEEYYRFGIVYILDNNELSPVFDVAGFEFPLISEVNITKEAPFEQGITIPNVLDVNNYFNDIYEKEGDYFVLDENGNYIRKYLLITEDKISGTNINTKGVVKMPTCLDNTAILGIKFNIPEEVYIRLSKLTKGYFFVRQKRIPTILCQGVVAGLEKTSHLPILKTDGTGDFFIERFINNQGFLTKDFNQRLYIFDKKSPNIFTNRTMFSPEVNVNLPYYNLFFTGENYVCKKLTTGSINRSKTQERSFIHKYTTPKEFKDVYDDINIINVQDGTKIVTNQNLRYSARAGEPEEAWRFSFVDKKRKAPKAPKKKLFDKAKELITGPKKDPFIQHTNMVRGVWGTYCGIDKYNGEYGDLLNIYIPGYESNKFDDYLKVRMNDKSEYYAISDRKTYLNWRELGYKAISPKNQKPCYRGDCYICQFTHRINRNHIDPETTLNDEIIVESTWADNFKQGDLESNNKIIRGDVNAVPIGIWLTMTVRSSINLCIRAIDDTNVNESTLFGHGRTFFPLTAMSTNSAYKTPESSVHNSGFNATVSNKVNIRFPEVPYLRNEFNTRIIFSNKYIDSGFKNGFRVFNLPDYIDYPKELGSITKILSYGNYLIAVFDHGIGRIPVNERSTISGAEGEVFINSTKLISKEGIVILSDTFGSKWKDSIIGSDGWIYGIDTVAKKIWRTNGNQLEVISDETVQSFLNYNIDLREREITSIEGIRNVKTHYNAYKKDVMFTFYNASRGIQENAWNLCYNETTKKFTTFYSWLPSLSENIDNMYFSFNRKVSKWIAKIAESSERYKPANGLVLSDPVIANHYLNKKEIYLGKKLSYIQAIIAYNKLSEEDKKANLNSMFISFDCYLRYRNHQDSKIKASDFLIDETNINSKYFTLQKVTPSNTKKEEVEIKFNLLKYLQDFEVDLSKIKDSDTLREAFKERYYNRKLDSKSTRKYLSPIFLVDMITTEVKDLLYKDTNALIVFEYVDDNGKSTSARGKATKSINIAKTTKKIAITLECLLEDYSRDSLFSTDFWKHGLAGIFDLQDDIKPTHWYGELHPFEFEFIVNKDAVNKILNNLVIISNNAEPESFHYTIVGDNYDWTKDKPNMYFRQEATKSLLQKNGFDISYDKSFRLHNTNKLPKSTYLMKEYEREDSLDELYDTYYSKLNGGYNYGNRTGSEILYNKILNEYSIVTNQKAISINLRNNSNEEIGRLRGNMHYKEGKWNVEVRPLYITLKNEQDSLWVEYKGKKIPPIVIPQSGFIQEELNIEQWISNYNLSNTEIMINLELYTDYADIIDNPPFKGVWSYIKSAKLSDKYIKVKVRYKGDKLAVITAIQSLYTQTYS